MLKTMHLTMDSAKKIPGMTGENLLEGVTQSRRGALDDLTIAQTICNVKLR